MTFHTGAPTEVCDDPLMKPTYHIDNFGATDISNDKKYTLTVVPASNGADGESRVVAIAKSQKINSTPKE